MGYVQLLSIRIKAAVTIGVQDFMWTYAFFVGVWVVST